MKILKPGSTGPSVQLLQLALNRAGYGGLSTDGVFGTATRGALIRFQAARALTADGVAGGETYRALLPWYTGYAVHRARRGDSPASVAAKYDSRAEAVVLANPGIAPENIPVGAQLIVPLPFDVVPTTIDYCSALVGYCVRGLAARYPFITTGELGKSVMGRPLWSLSLGHGTNRVLYNAGHHANEWICTPLLLRFAEQLAAAYPRYSFPEGWKANIRGIDLNLQYPALWEQAKANKYALGITSPAPGDFVGTAPLTAPESRAMYEFTREFDPALTLAYHTQGEVIYWRFLDLQPPKAEKIASVFAEAAGYAAEDTPCAAGFAGYRDWYIKAFGRPGYTIEAGLGANPLPISALPEMYERNLGILTLGALVT